MSDKLFWKYFFELFESIPRQGPGLDRYTHKALQCLPTLRGDQRILDIGCGAGVQTLELARRSDAQILATDFHAPFLEILKQRAAKEGFGDRISTQVADMASLPFADQSFDVLWAEGSIFIIGFGQGLAKWRRLLKPGGFLVVSEFTWFADNPPEELRKYCVPNESEDASLASRREAIAKAGYKLIEEIPLPLEAWKETYYAPLQEQLEVFEKRHADNPEALAVSKRSRYEMELFERYTEFFGYTFFILKD